MIALRVHQGLHGGGGRREGRGEGRGEVRGRETMETEGRGRDGGRISEVVIHIYTHYKHSTCGCSKILRTPFTS